VRRGKTTNRAVQIFVFYSPILCVMGGERASTTRMRLGGQICALCARALPEPHTRGEKRCLACGGTRRVYMTFMNRAGWYCQFLESDLRTSLHRTLTFATPGKIIEVAERGGGLKDLADRQALEVGIAKGRGGIYLELTAQQYAALQRR
jgi:hypothetical protein